MKSFNNGFPEHNRVSAWDIRRLIIASSRLTTIQMTETLQQKILKTGNYGEHANVGLKKLHEANSYKTTNTNYRLIHES